MNTQSTHVSTGLTAGPENSQVTLVVKFEKLRLVNGSHTKLSLNSRNQRRSLEQSTGKVLKCAAQFLLVLEGIVKPDNADVLLTSTLLGLDQTGSSVNTDNQTTGNLGIESTTVTSLLNTEDTLDPSNNFVTTGIGRFVEVDDTTGDVRLDIALQGRATSRNGSVMSATHKKLVVVLQQ
jgi:hypothetical protein